MVSCIMCNDLLNPIRKVLNERRKQKHLLNRGRFRSVYRDLLFLAFHALGRENIDHGKRFLPRHFNNVTTAVRVKHWLSSMLLILFMT